jgi:proteic killer suppression protein
VAIRSFAHKGLEAFFCEGREGGIGARYRRRVRPILTALHAATCTADLAGSKDFHELSGPRKGTYSMHVNGNWCITFKFDEGTKGDIINVNFEDYHRR